MKTKRVLWMPIAIEFIAIVIGASIGFFVGLDIQKQREWDKGYNVCLMKLLHYRNAAGKSIDVQEFIERMKIENYQVASIE